MNEQMQKTNPEEQPEQTETLEVIQTEPEELDDLQKRVRDYSDRKWNAILIVCGGLVGLLCGALLTIFSAMESIGMYGTIGAVVIALLVPRLTEKRVRRSVQRGRVALMISFALWLAVTAVVLIVKGVPVFTK